MSLADHARNFWCAAYFYRRAPDRDRTLAVKVLRQVEKTTIGPVHARATTLLTEIENGTDTDKEPPRAS